MRSSGPSAGTCCEASIALAEVRERSTIPPRHLLTTGSKADVVLRPIHVLPQYHGGTWSVLNVFQLDIQCIAQQLSSKTGHSRRFR